MMELKRAIRRRVARGGFGVRRGDAGAGQCGVISSIMVGIASSENFAFVESDGPAPGDVEPVRQAERSTPRTRELKAQVHP